MNPRSQPRAGNDDSLLCHAYPLCGLGKVTVVYDSFFNQRLENGVVE